MNRDVRLATLCESGYFEGLFPYENIASLIHLMFLKPELYQCLDALAITCFCLKSNILAIAEEDAVNKALHVTMSMAHSNLFCTEAIKVKGPLGNTTCCSGSCVICGLDWRVIYFCKYGHIKVLRYGNSTHQKVAHLLRWNLFIVTVFFPLTSFFTSKQFQQSFDLKCIAW